MIQPLKYSKYLQSFYSFVLVTFVFLAFFDSQNKHPITCILANKFDQLFLEPYLLPKEKKLFYKYLDSAHIYFEFGSGGFTHQAAKRRLKIYSVEISDSWHYLLKNEFDQIKRKISNLVPKNEEYENLANFTIDITYLLVELQSNLKPSNQDRQKFVKIYNHTKYQADYIVIHSLYPFSCAMNVYSEIDKNTIIFLTGLEKNVNYTLLKEYYDIIEQADRSFILRKKDQNHLPTKQVLKKIEKDDFRFKTKKRYLAAKFLKIFYGIYEKYKYSNNSESYKPKTNNIWVFWYQGFNSLPTIVQICLTSLQKHFHYGTITYLNKTNYVKYASIPQYIIDKFEAKKLTITHFSDILRSTLLTSHGGLWLDATIFVSREIPSYVFDLPYFTIHCNSNFSSIMGKWTGFIQSSFADSIVPKLCTELLFAYWEKFDYKVDYLLLDIFMIFGYEYIPIFRRIVESVPLSNDVYDLINNANKMYSKEKYDSIMSKNNFFKMSWKKDFSNNVNGNKTIYGFLEEQLFKK